MVKLMNVIEMEGRITKIISQASGTSDVFGIQMVRRYGTKVKFSILPQKMDEFFAEFCEMCEEDARVEGSDESPNYHLIGHPIAEVITKTTIPVMFHLIFPFVSDDDGTEFFKERFLLDFLAIVQSVILSKVEIDPSFYQLISTYECSPVWNNNGTSYIQMRVMFPYCHVDTMYQRGRFRDAILESLNRSHLFDQLYHRPTVGWKDILKEIGESIPMYRGKYTLDEAPMSFEGAYHVITQEILASGYVEPLQLATNVFNPETYQYVHQGTTSKAFLSKDVDLDYWIPMFLSIYFWPGQAQIKETIQASPKTGEHSVEYDAEATSDDPRIMCQHLMPLISSERLKIRPFWEEVVQILFNIFDGEERGLSMAIQHSERAEGGFTREQCAEFYQKLNRDHLTVKTLGWYARRDNPKGYEEWHNHWTQPSLMQSLKGTNYDIGDIIYRIFWLDHMYDSGSGIWYAFQNHKLRVQNDFLMLRKDIQSKLVPIYHNLRVSLSNQSYQDSNKDARHIEKLIEDVTSIIRKFRSDNTISSAVRAARIHFDVQDFSKIKDSNPFKTGWNNCVVVCSGNHAYTIEGKPEDFITKSTFCTFRADFSWKHPIVLRLFDWLNKVFPDQELLHYFLKDLSSMLYGKNAEKLFRAWVGEGNNSKTMLAKAIQAWLGMYAVDFPEDFLTAKKQGGSSPTPELAQAAGSHVGFIPEAEDDRPIREADLKRKTGGDRVFARFCNENGGSMEMWTKLVMMCNKVPEFTSVSLALRNRFIYLPFLSTWRDKDVPEDPAEQMRQRVFLSDPFFDSQIPELAQALGWVAVQYYSYYKAEGLKPPPIVVKYTEEHWEENDPVLMFIQEKIGQTYAINELGERIIDASKTLTMTEIYPAYRTWFTQRYNVHLTPVPSQTTIKTQFDQRLGKQENRRWHGIQLLQKSQAVTDLSNVLGGGQAPAMPAPSIPSAIPSVSGTTSIPSLKNNTSAATLPSTIPSALPTAFSTAPIATPGKLSLPAAIPSRSIPTSLPTALSPTHVPVTMHVGQIPKTPIPVIGGK